MGESSCPLLVMRLLLNHVRCRHTESSVPDWMLAYYGSFSPKLMALKQKWDPHNYFRSQQSVPLPAMTSLSTPSDHE